MPVEEEAWELVFNPMPFYLRQSGILYVGLKTLDICRLYICRFTQFISIL